MEHDIETYPLDPELVVGISPDEHAALVRIASEILDQNAAGWLAAMSHGDGYYKSRFSDLYDHLKEFITKWDLVDEIRAGCVSAEDAQLYAGMLSHCLQRHVSVDDILDGGNSYITLI